MKGPAGPSLQLAQPLGGSETAWHRTAGRHKQAREKFVRTRRQQDPPRHRALSSSIVFLFLFFIATENENRNGTFTRGLLAVPLACAATVEPRGSCQHKSFPTGELADGPGLETSRRRGNAIHVAALGSGQGFALGRWNTRLTVRECCRGPGGSLALHSVSPFCTKKRSEDSRPFLPPGATGKRLCFLWIPIPH